MPDWSKEQLSAMNLRGRELMVSAAAGSGKTAVLVERIVRMVCDPVHPVNVSNLLVMTFTNAAAAEMRSRLYDALLNRAKDEPENAHLRRQLTLIGQAHVQTFDSFCQSVIRNHFHAIELDPSTRLLDDSEEKMLIDRVYEAFIEEKYEENTPEFRALSDYFSTAKDDGALKTVILELYRFSRNNDDPAAWLENCKKIYETTAEELETRPWMQAHFLNLKVQVSEYEGLLDEFASHLGPPYMGARRLPLLKEMADGIRSLISASTYREFYDRILAYTPPKKQKTDKNEREKEGVTAEDNEFFNDTWFAPLNTLMKELRNKVFDPDELILGLKRVKPYMETLIDCVLSYGQALAKRKKKDRVMNFSDAAHYALSILTDGDKPSEIAKELSLQFEEIMIDEYQDSSWMQEKILTVVSREVNGTRNIFVVGDKKQSIYRFRNACPELFVGKFNRFVPASDAPDGHGQVIELNANYRSRKCVTDTVNFIFTQLMRSTVGDIDYNEHEALITKADYPDTPAKTGGTTEILLYDKDAIPAGEPEISFISPEAEEEAAGTESAEEDAESLKDAVIEAHMLAQEIRRLRAAGFAVRFKDKNKNEGYRPVEYRDIVVLLRSTKAVGEIFANVFSTYDIPSHVEKDGGFYTSFEISFVISLLRLIANPLDDISMAAVLASPIIGFTNRELSRVRISTGRTRPAGGFYGRVSAYALRHKDEELGGRLSAFLDKLRELRCLSAEIPVSELIRRIYRDFSVISFMSAMPEGARRRANLEMLAEKAADFGRQQYAGLYNFIEYVCRQEADNEEGAAETGTDQDNLVRIMTIHKSKGLEFPVVFISNIGKTFFTKEAGEKQPILLDSDLGIGIDAIDLTNRIRHKSIYKTHILRDKYLREMHGEELRLLYVAMTRAREKLYLTAGGAGRSKIAKKLRDFSVCWDQPVSPYKTKEILSATSYLDWILMAYKNASPAVKLSILTEKDILAGIRKQKGDDAENREALMKTLALPASKYAGETLREILDSDYRKDSLCRTPVTKTVSALKMEAMMAGEDPAEEHNYRFRAIVEDRRDETSDGEAPRITGAARGTLYHLVMEHLRPEEDIGDGLDRLLKEGVLTSEEEKAIIEPQKIAAFRASNVGKRFRAAYEKGRAFREKQFIIGLPVKEVERDSTVTDPEELVMIQGVIDLYFEEEDGLVLVDYKTDRVKTMDELSDRYRVQLDYYEKALEMVTGKRVKERILYAFHLNREISL